jgi:hypothetical protein
MKTTNSFKQYNKNKFYNSIFIKTKELGFKPQYLPQEKDRTNFGYKLDWEKKTKEVESLLSKNGLEVYLKDASNNPILQLITTSTERPTGSQQLPTTHYEKIYRTKRIKKSKNDVALYTNIKNYYESNNRFADFTRKKKTSISPPTYDVIAYFFTDLYLNLKLVSTKNLSEINTSTVDLNIDVLNKKNKIYVTFSEIDLNVYVTSSRECLINGGNPPTNNFAYMLLGGKTDSEDKITIEEWCQINQPSFY